MDEWNRANVLLLLFTGLMMVLLIGVLAVSCASESTTTTAGGSQVAATTVAPNPSTNTSGAAETTAGTPKYGGTLRIIGGRVISGAGWPAGIIVGAAGIQFCYDTLLRGDEKGNVYPWLAESYEVAGDFASITFHIRHGVKFHDGSDLNAEVVKWNLEQYLNPAGATPPGGAAPPADGLPPGGAAPPADASPAGIPAGAPPAGLTALSGGLSWSSVDEIDDYTVRVNVTKWDSTTLSSFADTNRPIYMVSKVAYDKNGKEWMLNQPVGTGPFKFASYEQDVSLKLVRNPDYWAKDANNSKLPYLDGVELLGVADYMTQKMLAQKEEGELFQNATPGKEASDYAKLGLTTTYFIDANVVLVPDSAHPDSAWSNQKVREAAEYAIDRETIAQNFGFGYLKAPYQLPPCASAAYDPDFSLGRRYDPDKAKQLLVEAGLANGFKTVIIVDSLCSHDVAMAVQADWAKIGIDAELQFPTQSGMMQYLGPTGKWQNAVVMGPLPSQGVNFVGGLQFALSMWGENWSKPAELVRAVDAATNAASTDLGLVRTAASMMTQAAVVIPLYETGVGYASQRYVELKLGTRGMYPFWDTELMWLNK
jgi:peptide/nickel transport system substrate-binding protein